MSTLILNNFNAQGGDLVSNAHSQNVIHMSKCPNIVPKITVWGDAYKTLILQAYRQGMYGHKYVWILPGAAMYTSWTGSGLDDSELPCTKEQILEAARGYITLDHALIGETDHQTISGRVCINSV